jgi:hypothetical protein
MYFSNHPRPVRRGRVPPTEAVRLDPLEMGPHSYVVKDARALQAKKRRSQTCPSIPYRPALDPSLGQTPQHAAVLHA